MFVAMASIKIKVIKKLKIATVESEGGAGKRD